MQKKNIVFLLKKIIYNINVTRYVNFVMRNFIVSYDRVEIIVGDTNRNILQRAISDHYHTSPLCCFERMIFIKRYIACEKSEVKGVFTRV